MAEIDTAADQPDEAVARSLEVDASEVQVRDLARRELDIRIVPWNVAIDTIQGREQFARGAFTGTDPGSVLLMGPEHEARFGMGQDGRPVLTRVPTGKAIALDDRPDGQHATFRVARTAAGDEQLALAAEGIVTGASVEFSELSGGTSIEQINGRRVRTHNRARLHGVSTTYRPAYGEQAAVLAVRSQNEGDASVPPTETLEAPVAGVAPTLNLDPITRAIETLSTTQSEQFRSISERFAAFEEQNRANFQLPGPQPEQAPRAMRGEWMGAVLRMLSGERIDNQQMRALADLVTSDNVGVVPDAYSTELIGVIDPSRPFLNTTRKLDLPAAGMSLIVPKIVTRPTAGVQAIYKDESAPEKADITSTTTSITNATFDAITIAGGGDISLQLLKRSSPSYLSLYLELLAEAYAQNAETEALSTLAALVGVGSGVNDGGVLDPENLVLGSAWAAGAAVRKPINTMWLSSTAVGAFIDAKANTTNAPLYSSIQAGFTAGGGTGGTISGLRPVWVPALDTQGIDVLVGPSSGFGWTEDGTYTLQVDVPAKAGRDVALVGLLWFAPMYPTAFTAYTIGS